MVHVYEFLATLFSPFSLALSSRTYDDPRLNRNMRNKLRRHFFCHPTSLSLSLSLSSTCSCVWACMYVCMYIMCICVGVYSSKNARARHSRYGPLVFFPWKFSPRFSRRPSGGSRNFEKTRCTATGTRARSPRGITILDEEIISSSLRDACRMKINKKYKNLTLAREQFLALSLPLSLSFSFTLSFAATYRRNIFNRSRAVHRIT